VFANLGKLFRYRALVHSLVVRELKARYRGSVLGFFWSFVNPLLLLLIYSFVFTVVWPGARSGGLEPFALFMVCGILPWTWFQSSLLESCQSLIAGACVASPGVETKTSWSPRTTSRGMVAVTVKRPSSPATPWPTARAPRPPAPAGASQR